MTPKKRKQPDTPDAPGPDWHALAAEEVYRRTETRPGGLTAAEVAERLGRFGPNRLRAVKRRGPVLRFAAQFNNVLIYVLLGAAAVTAGLQHWTDTGVILGVVVVNAVIGFAQEGKAEKALDAIRDMLSPHAAVIRDGSRITVDAGELVPGDVILVESGDRVPADVRLVEARNLQAQEAALTGESVPVEKAAGAVARDAALGDRRSMAFAGTLVTVGRGTGVVVATGERTEIGHISTMLAEVETVETPLLRQLARFSRWLTGAILVIAAATFAFGHLVRGYGLDEMFLAAVGLAVAAIPEGLPAIMTITLAIGVERMARRNAIVRRLPAVETLGSVSVICSDKTGTLTRNEMTVQSVATAGTLFEVTGAGYLPAGSFHTGDREVAAGDQPLLREMARGALLCSDATVRETASGWTVDGDPTEGALVVVAMKAGLDPRFEAQAFPRTDVIPFESEHRFMASLHHDHEGAGFVYVKGAPERILTMCETQAGPDGAEPLDAAAWGEVMETISARGQRILALARRATTIDHQILRFDDVTGGFCLLGLFGLADPPRQEAVTAIALCHAAGIDVKMITGDHAGTARAIARAIGLRNTGTVLTGADIDAMDDAELVRRAAGVGVFARTSPAHKLRLVTALQDRGAVVSMTGDGVNDAPALKRADVGVAMGMKGTEAAKEAAEMVLADDNFASIAHAVEEGRTIYDNLKKAITFILPTNGGEAVILLVAIALGTALPITAVQILWVNMITAVTLALALAFEPAEPDVMNRPPRRPDEPILSRFLMWRVMFVSAILVVGTFGLFLYERDAGASLEFARTVAVSALVMFEVFYLFNTRFLWEPVLNRRGLLGSRAALIAVAVVLVLQAAFVYAPPLQHLFATEAMDAWAWLRVVAVGAALLFIVEAEKTVMRGYRARFRAARRRDSA